MASRGCRAEEIWGSDDCVACRASRSEAFMQPYQGAKAEKVVGWNY